MTALTPGQRDALAVMARAASNNQAVGVSTYTSPVGDLYPFVDWVTARELMGLGFVEADGAAVVLTPAGRQRASDEGMG